MKIIDCIRAWATEAGFAEEQAHKQARLFAESITGPSASEIDLNEAEQVIGKAMFLKALEAARKNPGKFDQRISNN